MSATTAVDSHRGAEGHHTAAHAYRPGRVRSKTVLPALAALLALWLGLTAPAVSPVAPPVIPPAATAPQQVPDAGLATAVPLPTPVDPGPRGGR